MSHDFGDSPEAQSIDQNRDTNPYASPLADGPLLASQAQEEPIGIWRSGNALLMHRLARLPNRCICTNQSCDESEHHSFLLDSRNKARLTQGAVMISGAALTGTFLALRQIPNREGPAILVALLTLLISWLCGFPSSKEMVFSFYYSHPSRRRRKEWRYIAASLFGIGVTLFAAAAPYAFRNRLVAVLVLCGSVLTVFGALLFGAASFPLRIERNAGNYLLIKGCGIAFLNSFPDAEAPIHSLHQHAANTFFRIG